MFAGASVAWVRPHPVVSSSTGAGHHVVRGRPSSVGRSEVEPGVAQRAAVGDRERDLPVEGEPAGVRHPPRREVPRSRRQCEVYGSPASSIPSPWTASRTAASCGAAAAGGGATVAIVGRPRRSTGRPRTAPCRRRRPRRPSTCCSSRGPCRARPPTPRRAAARRGAGSWCTRRCRVAAHHHHVVDVVRPERSEGHDTVGAHGCDRSHRTMIGLVVRGGDGFAVRPARGVPPCSDDLRHRRAGPARRRPAGRRPQRPAVGAARRSARDPSTSRRASRSCTPTCPRLRAGRVGAQFWSVYVPCSFTGPAAVAAVLEQVALVRRLAERYPDDLRSPPPPPRSRRRSRRAGSRR